MQKSFRSIVALVVFISSLIAPVWSAPGAGTVTSGNANISVAGTATNIQQSTQKAIINWNGFNTATNESVNFQQPNSQAVALNRDQSGSQTNFFGSLNANGQVFLLNPNGIVFGPQSQVNVGGLVASTLSLSDTNFLNGNYAFSAPVGTLAGSVTNQGFIQAPQFAALIAPTVTNTGTIYSPGGQIGLAGASGAQLSFVTNPIDPTNNLMTLVTQVAPGVNDSNTSVTNYGKIMTNTGLAGDTSPEGNIILATNGNLNLMSGSLIQATAQTNVSEEYPMNISLYAAGNITGSFTQILASGQNSNVSINAGNNLNLSYSQLSLADSPSAANGITTIQTGNDLDLTATQVTQASGADLNFNAGEDINANGLSINSNTAHNLNLTATRDINLTNSSSIKNNAQDTNINSGRNINATNLTISDNNSGNFSMIANNNLNVTQGQITTSNGGDVTLQGINTLNLKQTGLTVSGRNNINLIGGTGTGSTGNITLDQATITLNNSGNFHAIADNNMNITSSTITANGVSDFRLIATNGSSDIESSNFTNTSPNSNFIVNAGKNLKINNSKLIENATSLNTGGSNFLITAGGNLNIDYSTIKDFGGSKQVINGVTNGGPGELDIIGNGNTTIAYSNITTNNLRDNVTVFGGNSLVLDHSSLNLTNSGNTYVASNGNLNIGYSSLNVSGGNNAADGTYSFDIFGKNIGVAYSTITDTNDAGYGLYMLANPTSGNMTINYSNIAVNNAQNGLALSAYSLGAVGDSFYQNGGVDTLFAAEGPMTLVQDSITKVGGQTLYIESGWSSPAPGALGIYSSNIATSNGSGYLDLISTGAMQVSQSSVSQVGGIDLALSAGTNLGINQSTIQKTYGRDITIGATNNTSIAYSNINNNYGRDVVLGVGGSNINNMLGIAYSNISDTFGRNLFVSAPTVLVAYSTMGVWGGNNFLFDPEYVTFVGSHMYNVYANFSVYPTGGNIAMYGIKGFDVQSSIFGTYRAGNIALTSGGNLSIANSLISADQSGSIYLFGGQNFGIYGGGSGNVALAQTTVVNNTGIIELATPGAIYLNQSAIYGAHHNYLIAGQGVYAAYSIVTP